MKKFSLLNVSISTIFSVGVFLFFSLWTPLTALGIENPSFETGDYTGWDSYIPLGGWINIVSSHSAYTPQDGIYFALLKTNGPGSYTTLSQTFHASAGSKISGWAFFDAQDYLPFNFYIFNG